MGDFWTTRRHGLTIRFERSGRSNRLRLVAALQWKTLQATRFDVADFYGNETMMHDLEVKAAFVSELATIADRLKNAPQFISLVWMLKTMRPLCVWCNSGWSVNHPHTDYHFCPPKNPCFLDAVAVFVLAAILHFVLRLYGSPHALR